MTRLSFTAQLNPDQTISVPDSIVEQVPKGQEVRVVLLVGEPANGDAICDQPPSPDETKDRENPWLAMAGIFDKDDPLVKEWIEIMAENRRKEDAVSE
jgi:hypothetical protein